MLVLGIDSSALSSSVCLLEDRTPVALFSLFSNSEHSVSLLPMIEDTFKRSGKTINDVDLISAVVGPGSFTGIRIGISVVKGLAFPAGTPCVGVSSLEAGAYTLSDVEGYICPMLDARRNTVYTSLFHSDGKGKIGRLTEDGITELPRIGEDFPDVPVYITGDVTDDALRILPDGMILKIHEHSIIPWAYGCALCGEARYLSMTEQEKENAKGGDNLYPMYLRKTLPERIREEKIKNV